MIFLDSSILVAAAQKQHAKHEECFALLQAAGKKTCACSTHALAELYSTLTGMPRPVRLPPSAALAIVRRIAERVRVVPLTAEEYLATLDSLAARGLIGGNVYDALHMHCARKVDAKTIYTLNPADFKRVDSEWADRVRVPERSR